jgi:hypothetical protein
MDYSGNGYNATINGADRVTTIGTNQAMYYDASSSDYILTPSFAIPNTGILTIEAWMKIKDYTERQVIVSDYSAAVPTGFIRIYRYLNSTYLYYGYSDGTAAIYPSFSDFFLNLDDQ